MKTIIFSLVLTLAGSGVSSLYNPAFGEDHDTSVLIKEIHHNRGVVVVNDCTDSDPAASGLFFLFTGMPIATCGDIELQFHELKRPTELAVDQRYWLAEILKTGQGNNTPHTL